MSVSEPEAGQVRAMTLQRINRAVFVAFVVALAYGFGRFPLAPYVERDGQYFDKMGNTHSVREYEDLKIWEKVFFTLGISSFTLAGYCYMKRPR